MANISDEQRAAEAAACPYCRRKAEDEANARLAWENERRGAERDEAIRTRNQQISRVMDLERQIGNERYGAAAEIKALAAKAETLRAELRAAVDALREANKLMNHFGDVLNGMDCVDAVEAETGVSNSWVFGVFGQVQSFLAAYDAEYGEGK